MSILVPFSKNIVLLLQHRILDAYRAIALVMPNGQIKQRIADVQTQIKNVQENYSNQDEGHFKTPESDRQAIQMLQLVKKMRAVLRVEHNKGKIDPSRFCPRGSSPRADAAQDQHLQSGQTGHGCPASRGNMALVVSSIPRGSLLWRAWVSDKDPLSDGP